MFCVYDFWRLERCFATDRWLRNGVLIIVIRRCSGGRLRRWLTPAARFAPDARTSSLTGEARPSGGGKYRENWVAGTVGTSAWGGRTLLFSARIELVGCCAGWESRGGPSRSIFCWFGRVAGSRYRVDGGVDGFSEHRRRRPRPPELRLPAAARKSMSPASFLTAKSIHQQHVPHRRVP